jgi:hypothetical protein
LDKLAAGELFKNVYISPSEEHITSWNSISQDDVIRRIPRHATIHTHPDIPDDGLTRIDADADEDDGDVEGFGLALAALSQFPNLTSVEIGFTEDCLGREDRYYNNVPEDWTEREEKLELIFQAIKDRATDKKNRTIRKLTITNLQNCPLPEFTSSDLFRDVVGQLEELHVSITQEYNEHGPDHDYTKIELRTFPAYFCSHWLEPVSANLKALSIYNRENWGPFPGYWDFSSISFPKLESLALGYYTLAHDDDLNWILAIKSLRKLILHNCMIASSICIERDNITQWKPRMHDWTKVGDEPENAVTNGYEAFAYDGKWNEYLDRIAESLPNLINFRFGYGPGYAEPPGHRYGVTRRDGCPVEIFHQRYICFDNGTLPTHWPEPRDSTPGMLDSWFNDGFPINVHKETLDADQKSLDALLCKIKSRK